MTDNLMGLHISQPVAGSWHRMVLEFGAECGTAQPASAKHHKHLQEFCFVIISSLLPNSVGFSPELLSPSSLDFPASEGPGTSVALELFCV